MASSKSGNPSGYNKTGGKKNDPNRANFVAKYIKQNTKSADRPATKKQARNAYYLTSVDDKKGARGAKKTPGKKTASGSMSSTRADGTKPGLRVRGMDSAGPVVRAGVGAVAKSTPKKKVAVASKGQSIRSADKASDAKRRKSGTTRGSRGMY
jgi:hypothetical protein